MISGIIPRKAVENVQYCGNVVRSKLISYSSTWMFTCPDNYNKIKSTREINSQREPGQYSNSKN